MDPFLGQIMAVGFNFAPRGWATCNGQLLPISQNQALFSLLGITFGGDGRQTFGLPNLGGRTAVGTGQSGGTSNYTLGQSAGTETVTLTSGQLPTHTHAAVFSGSGSTLSASSTVQGASVGPVANATLGRANDIAPNGTSKPAIYAPAGSATDTQLAGLNVAGTVAVTPAGNSQPVSVLSPYQALTMIIAVEGIYPSRP